MRASKLTIEPATEAHAAQLAKHIRPEDAAEMLAAYGLEPLDGLKMAVRSSSVSKVILDGSRVVALLGVAPTGSDGVASVWLLGGRLVKQFPVAFTKACANALREWLQEFGVLINMVWEKNATALRWLESLGFEVSAPVPFGVAGLPFHPVCARRS